MTDRELRKMNRKELLELLIALKEENDQLKVSLQQQEEKLQSRDIQFKDAGSLAEASLVLNSVFESADKAAAQYLENIKRCSEQQARAYNRIVSEAEQKAKKILDDAEIEKQKKIQAADDHLHKVKAGIEAYYNAHPELRASDPTQARRKTSENG